MKATDLRRELPGQTVSDPVQQDSLKAWSLKTSSLKAHKDPLACPLGCLYSVHIWKGRGSSSYGSRLTETIEIS